MCFENRPKAQANNLFVFIGLKVELIAFNIMGMIKFNYKDYMTE